MKCWVKNVTMLTIALLLLIVYVPDIALAYDSTNKIDGDINIINDKIISNTNKTWILRFSSSVNANSIINKVHVKDLSDGTVTAINLIAGDSGNLVKVIPPPQGYKLGHSYQVSVDSGVMSKKGKSLSRSTLMNFKVIDINGSNYIASVKVAVSPVLSILKQVTVNSTNFSEVKKFRIDGNNKVFNIGEQAVSAVNTSNANIYFYGNDGVTQIAKGVLNVSQSNNSLDIKLVNAEQ